MEAINVFQDKRISPEQMSLKEVNNSTNNHCVKQSVSINTLLLFIPLSVLVTLQTDINQFFKGQFRFTHVLYILIHLSPQETLRTLDPELLEEFLRAAKGMEAFCTPSQLRDMEFYTQCVRTQWEVGS